MHGSLYGIHLSCIRHGAAEKMHGSQCAYVSSLIKIGFNLAELETFPESLSAKHKCINAESYNTERLSASQSELARHRTSLAVPAWSDNLN